MMTHREAVTTLTALEKNSNRKVVIKVITKNENTSCTLKPLKKLKECNCKYIVEYIRCFQTEKEYWVEIHVVILIGDCKGVLRFGIIGSDPYKEESDEDALCEIASCCLLGLDFLHSRRIVSTVSEMAWNDGLERQTMESVHG